MPVNFSSRQMNVTEVHPLPHPVDGFGIASLLFSYYRQLGAISVNLFHRLALACSASFFLFIIYLTNLLIILYVLGFWSILAIRFLSVISPTYTVSLDSCSSHAMQPNTMWSGVFSCSLQYVLMGCFPKLVKKWIKAAIAGKNLCKVII